jgi:hypothetical protein
MIVEQNARLLLSLGEEGEWRGPQEKIIFTFPVE